MRESGLVEPEVSSVLQKSHFLPLKKKKLFRCVSPFRSSPLCTLPDPLLADRDPWPTSWLYLGMNAKRGVTRTQTSIFVDFALSSSSNQCCAERTFGGQERDSCVLGQIQPKSILKPPEGVRTRGKKWHAQHRISRCNLLVEAFLSSFENSLFQD